MNIFSSRKSRLPFKSSSLTSIGKVLTSSSTSSGKLVLISYLYTIDKISTPGSFLCPIILTTLPSAFLLLILLTISTTTLCPSTALRLFSLATTTSKLTLSSSKVT